jgi:hypothetical protein
MWINPVKRYGISLIVGFDNCIANIVEIILIHITYDGEQIFLIFFVMRGSCVLPQGFLRSILIPTNDVIPRHPRDFFHANKTLCLCWEHGVQFYCSQSILEDSVIGRPHRRASSRRCLSRTAKRDTDSFVSSLI